MGGDRRSFTSFRFERSVSLIERHSFPPKKVTLEITESSVASNLGAALGALARLRLKGFGLPIDDCGTGFSSAQQPARIPFAELKVDRSFVHGAHRRNQLRVLLESALGLAQRFNLVSVAEGIETIEDWSLLQRLGCSIGQGYPIGRPMAAEALPDWLRAHESRRARWAATSDAHASR